MRKFAHYLGIVFLFTVSAQASSDICSQLPGYWFGTTNYKKIDDCRRAGTCTQMLTSEINFVSNGMYQGELSPPVFGRRMVKFTCKNGEITPPLALGGMITFSCEEGAMCRIVYENERVIAGISKIS